MIRYARILALLMIFLISFPVYAADIDDAIWSANVRVRNTGAAASGVETVFTLDTDNLINNQYCYSDLSNVCVLSPTGEDIAYMPARSGTDKWAVWVPRIGQSATQLYQFYSGGSTDMNGKLRYFPGDGGMVTDDSASLELGNNFEVELNGYFNTANAYELYLYKQNAFAILATASNTIAAQILTSGTIGASLHTNSVDIYAGHSRAGNQLPNFSGIINSISVYLMKNGSPTGTGYIRIREATTDAIITTIGSFDVAAISGSWTAYTYTATSPLIFTNRSIKITVEYDGGNADNLIYVGYAAGGAYHFYSYDTSYHDLGVNYSIKISTDTASKSASIACASGEHIIKAYADGTDLGISVDGGTPVTTALVGASVPNTAYNYYSFINSSMPYMEYQKITVGGTLQQHIYWQNAAVFEDASDGNHDATPTFRESTSNANVTATFTDFRPASTAIATYTPTDVAPMITSTPTHPEHMYTENDYSNIPGADFINDILDNGNIPRSFFWIPAIFILALIAGFAIFALSHSLMAMAISSGIIMAIFSFMGAVPLWCIIPFAIFAVAAIVKRESPGGL